MLDVEEATVIVALVTESKVNAIAILGCSPHKVGQDAGDVEE